MDGRKARRKEVREGGGKERRKEGGKEEVRERKGRKGGRE